MVRVKRRYLTIQFLPHDNRIKRIDASERDVAHLLKDAIHHMHGDFGLGSVQKSLQVKKFSPETGVAVVSVQRGQHELLTSAIPFVRKFKDMNCSLQLIYLSGTIRCSIKNLIKMYQNQSVEFTKQLSQLRHNQPIDTAE